MLVWGMGVAPRPWHPLYRNRVKCPDFVYGGMGVAPAPGTRKGCGAPRPWHPQGVRGPAPLAPTRDAGPRPWHPQGVPLHVTLIASVRGNSIHFGNVHGPIQCLLVVFSLFRL